MSFASGPGRDDGSLPPVNIVIPDDARELDRDVLAYRRELRKEAGLVLQAAQVEKDAAGLDAANYRHRQLSQRAR